MNLLTLNNADIEHLFKDTPCTIHSVSSVDEAKSILSNNDIDVCLVEVANGGMEFIRWMHSNDVDTVAIIVTNEGTYGEAVEAIDLGVPNWFDKCTMRNEVLISTVIDQAKLIPDRLMRKFLSATR